MAFSLEAAVIVPLVIGTWLGMTLAVIPAGEKVRQAASLEEQATISHLDHQHLYRTALLREGTVWITDLQTSPQTALELFMLIRDDGRIINHSLPAILDGQILPIGGES